MDKEYVKKYNELVKKHQLLNKRYTELEKLEEQLENNTTLSDEARLANLNKLAEEYEKVANLMKQITEEAQALEEKMSD